jgi:hypothetical protein
MKIKLRQLQVGNRYNKNLITNELSLILWGLRKLLKQVRLLALLRVQVNMFCKLIRIRQLPQVLERLLTLLIMLKNNLLGVIHILQLLVLLLLKWDYSQRNLLGKSTLSLRVYTMICLIDILRLLHTL